MSLQEFYKEVNNNRSVPAAGARAIFVSLLTSFVLLGGLYGLKFRFVDNFIGNYGFFLFFASIIYALLAGALLQVRAYGQFPCMSGMMVGMTLGMIAGFIPGFVVASTNGMFVGSLFGMVLGIAIGVFSGGRCCGVMGFLEGSMAGFMGGLMGAMTAFMLLNDHLRTTTVIVSLFSTIILLALNYMIYREGKQLEVINTQNPTLFTIAFSFIATLITTWIMLYGPRTGIFS